MATLSLGNKTIFTQAGSADPVMSSGVNVKNAFSSLDTSASQGPTTDLTNTTLPIFACRAWVHFNGGEYTTINSENRCTIRASGNVSKVVRDAVGVFSIYFATPMPDTNYAIADHVGSFNQNSADATVVGIRCFTSDVNFYKISANYSTTGGSIALYDHTSISLIFYR